MKRDYSDMVKVRENGATDPADERKSERKASSVDFVLAVRSRSCWKM